MAVKIFLIFVTVSAFVEFLAASPTRRQYVAITEASASDSSVTNDGNAWDDNDEFDLDGDGWFSQAAVSPSSVPEKAQEYNNEYDDDYSHGNAMMEFGDDDEDEDEHLQEAEEEDGSRNDSEFLFVPPRDTRLVLEDDNDDQSGPIKVRHTGRSSYPRVSDGSDNSLESSSDEEKEDNEHPYEFTIDEDDKDDEEEEAEEEAEDSHKEDDSDEVLPRHEAREDDDDEDEFVSEGDDSDDMFDNPDEEAAQVIYGDHVFLY